MRGRATSCQVRTCWSDGGNRSCNAGDSCIAVCPSASSAKPRHLQVGVCGRDSIRSSTSSSRASRRRPYSEAPSGSTCRPREAATWPVPRRRRPAPRPGPHPPVPVLLSRPSLVPSPVEDRLKGEGVIETPFKPSGGHDCVEGHNSPIAREVRTAGLDPHPRNRRREWGFRGRSGVLPGRSRGPGPAGTFGLRTRPSNGPESTAEIARPAPARAATRARR